MKYQPPLRPELSRAKNVARKGLANVQDRVKNLRERAQQGSVRARGTPDLQLLLERASRSRVGASPEFRQFRTCVEDEIARDNGADLLDGLLARHDAERDRLKSVVQFGGRLAERFRSMDTRRRVLAEAILPVHRGQIDAATAWNRIDALAGVQVRDEVARNAPGWTIGLGGGGEAGAGVGAGLDLGLCGIRHGPAMAYIEGSVGAGAKLELGATFHIQFAPCTPSEFFGFGVGVGVGAAYGVAAAVEIGFAPKFHKPSVKEPWVADWFFDSFTIHVGVGAGLDVSVSASFCGVAPAREFFLSQRRGTPA